MKGIEWNGDYFAEKGCTRSDGKYMFSVGNLVAFEVTTWSSPDGRDYGRGCIPCASMYKLQEEIILEEFNRTVSSIYNSGSYNIQTIIELQDRFWHEYSRPVEYKTFLLQILGSGSNPFRKEFIKGEITEVRNNPGKYLHIYEVPESYRKCKVANFAETVEAINLQKQKEEQEYADMVSKNFRGVELIFGITASGWYASGASFGRHSVQLQHEHDSTSRDHYRIIIMPCVPNGGTRGTECSWSCKSLHFYLPNGIPMSLSLYTDREPVIDTMTTTHWANSQSWHYDEIETLEIQKGWIFVDGVDVYDCTTKIIDENKATKAAARNEKFAIAKTKALEAGFTESQIGQIIKTSKGQVIANLNLVASMVTENKYGVAFVLQMFKNLQGKSPEVISSYSFLVSHAAEIKMDNVKRADKKAYAWAYLSDLIPGFGSGHFDDAMIALRLAIENKVPFQGAEFVNSGFEVKGESDLAIKLRKAGLVQ